MYKRGDGAGEFTARPRQSSSVYSGRGLRCEVLVSLTIVIIEIKWRT